MAVQMKRRARGSLKTGKKIPAKICIVDGIKFKSKLEAYTYNKLKAAGLEFTYEEHSFILISPGEYLGTSYELKRRTKTFENNPKYSKMSYTPDFVSEKEGWIIECKGHPNERFPIVWKLFKLLMSKTICKETNRHYDLYAPRNSEHVSKTIELILKNKQNDQKNYCLQS